MSRQLVDLDPVVAHLRRDARAGVGGEDDVGGLVGKVAVDALAGEGASAAWEEAAALNLMAGQAASGEIFDVALRDVDVVTRRTGHVRLLKTLAAFEQRDLVAVNV